MSGTIAKKYVNALMKSCNESEIAEINKALATLAEAFKIAKFNNIVLWLFLKLGILRGTKPQQGVND